MIFKENPKAKETNENFKSFKDL